MTNELETSNEVKTDKDAVKLVVDSFKDSDKYYREKFELFNYFDDLYIKGARKRNAPRGRANLQLPIAFQQVEDYTSQMMEAMFGEPPYLAYVGRGPEDDPVAEQITKFTQKQMEDGKMVKAASGYYRNCGKYGTAVMKVPWVLDQQEVEEVRVTADPITGEVVESTEIDVETIHDGPKFHNLSIFDFFVPRSATSTDIQSLDWCIHRTHRTLGELLRNPNYTNKKKLKAAVDGKIQVEIDGDGKITELEQHNSDGRRKFKSKIEVLEWWGDFNFESSEDDRERAPEPALLVVALVGDVPVLLRKDKNPFKYKKKPFVSSNDYPIEGEFYGYGELHHIRGLIEESTALRNARLDVANMSINHMWLIERQAGVNPRSLFSAPNKIVLTNDNAGVKRLDMGGVTPSSVQELARIDFDIQNTTQIVNPAGDVAGVGPGFGKTATGVSFLANRSNLRTLLKARIQEQDFFQPLALLLNSYNKEFVKTEQFFRVFDGEESPYEQLPPDAFLTSVDFKPTSNPQKVNRSEQRERMDYLLQVVAQLEKVAPGTYNLVNLGKEVFRVQGFSNPEKFMNSGPTQVFVAPDGQTLLDKNGQPVDVQPIPTEAGAEGAPQ